MVKNYKFLIRTASAKIPAGTSDIRRMMNVRDQLLEQYNRFRVKRIEKTLNVYKQETPFVLVHFLPVSAFDIESKYPIIEKRNSINLSILGEQDITKELMHMDYSINLLGAKVIGA